VHAHGDYILEVSNLNVKIQDQTLLKDLTFKVERGTTLAIVGPNGAGKSTLFRALLNLIPYTGEIRWAEGVRIGYVPQKLSVGDVPISVREFLSYKKNLIQECQDMEKCLGAVGLDDKGILDKALGVLSGGQLQRILIAWAIIDNPSVLLFDEPTSGVDLDSEEAIYEMLNRLEHEHGITVLLISHDVHIIRDYSEHALALNKSMICYVKSEEITKPSVLHAVYGPGTALKRRKRRRS
jgi:ABC-type Mn2+/Zn2+ transport system ATPase subunit